MARKKKILNRKVTKVRQSKSFLAKKRTLLILVAAVLVILAGSAYAGRSYLAAHFGNKSDLIATNQSQTQASPVTSDPVPSPTQPDIATKPAPTTPKKGNSPAPQPTPPSPTKVTWTTP